METIPLFNDQAALLDATPILHDQSPQDLAARAVFQRGEGRLVETNEQINSFNRRFSTENQH